MLYECTMRLTINCTVVAETWHSKSHASPQTMNLKRNAKIHTFIDKVYITFYITHSKFSLRRLLFVNKIQDI